jgi:hypothetical protein
MYKLNFRYWTEKRICWARNSNVQDIDDTAMAFRLLRLHGHQVSASEFTTQLNFSSVFIKLNIFSPYKIYDIILIYYKKKKKT